jgi:hypothetical protein
MIQRILSDVRDRSTVGSVVSDNKKLAARFLIISLEHFFAGIFKAL